MKLPVLLTALALACGGAYAQSGNDGAAAGPNTNDRAAVTSTAPATGEPVTKKIKRGAHKVADATRRAGHRISAGLKKATHRKDSTHASSSDTSSMGAAPSDDSARRARMDAAYDNFKRKQQK